MKPRNLIIMMADELSGRTLGCYGHPVVKTPHIDALAARGTRFASAYTNSPLCMPARACFATGQYVHQTGYWDNVLAYDGEATSWGHRLQTAGNRVTSIGKLHYTSEQAPGGIDEQIIPMHVVDNGDVYGLMREDPPARPQSAQLAAKVGAGESEYIRYDWRITELTEQWLQRRGSDERPWVLFVSWLAPHFPLVVPQEYLDRYRRNDIPLPKSLHDEGHHGHPWWETFHRCYDFDRYFRDDEHRRDAIHAYYALCSFVDDNVGRVLRALHEAGLEGDTDVVFTSDHGDNLGARGLWGKSTMYEESVGIPLVLAGPGRVPAGEVCRTPVSLVDFYPTILDAVGLSPTRREQGLPGRSLYAVAHCGYDAERTVFSEYHGSCATTGSFMLRRGRFKYVHYTRYEPQLFDLESDPQERTNLAKEPLHRTEVDAFERQLHAMLDPEEVDARAKRAQAYKVAALGGRETILSKASSSYTPAPV